MSKPNHNSLYSQLRRAKKLDELMRFLEDPSFPKPDTYSRCVKAESMLADWGFTHSPSTIWRLYRRHVLSWRAGSAPNSGATTENLADLEDDNRRMTARRTSEILAHPNLDPSVVVDLVRIQLQKKAIRRQQEKFKAALRAQLEMALSALDEEIRGNRPAETAVKALQEAIKL